MKSLLSLLFRVIKRNRLFSFLNIAGLAVGMASSVLIVLWIADELSYDRFHENADRIVRIKSYFKVDGEEQFGPFCPAPLANALINDYPEVENVVRMRNYGDYIVEYQDKVFNEPQVIFADSTFFKVFSFKLVSGDPNKVLNSSNKIVLSQSAAKKYFGDEDPVGKMLRLDNRIDMQITGVFEDMPSPSHIHFDFIGSTYTYEEERNDMWLSNNFHTYVLLKPNTDIWEFESKLPELIDKYISVQASQFLGMSWKEIQEGGTDLGYFITPLTDIHLHSKMEDEYEAPGSIMSVRIFGIIAIFIIIIACINFTNLSTARSITRLKEVGVRKTYGVSRRSLIRQFNIESLLIVVLAFILAMVLVELSLPYFNDLTGKELHIAYFSGKFLLAVLAMILVVSVMAGSYPSFYLSSFKPIHVLKGDAEMKGKKISFRSVLVIVQFFISLVLLSSTAVLSKQMKYMQNKDLGFDKEKVIAIRNTYLLSDNIEAFKQELERNPSVEKVSVSGYLPIPSYRNNSTVFPDANLSADLFNCQNWTVDADYIDTYGLKIVDGRNFSRDFATDTMALLINETAAKKLGWESPVGRILGAPNSMELDIMDLDEYTIIGVFEDFHFESLHLPIESQLLYLGRSTGNTSVRVNAKTDINSFITYLEKVWKDFAPGQPLTYDFIDQNLEQRYESEKRLEQLLSIFTIFAFFVSCLGLVGLSVFSSEQRKKEIGLRKTNGSSIGQIIWLLSTDFTKLVAVSFVLSVPVTVIFMQKWLAGFAYRTALSWWIFAITLGMTYAVAMIAIIFQSYQAATTNPADTFRTE